MQIVRGTPFVSGTATPGGRLLRAFAAWRLRRAEARALRLGLERLAALSPHYLDDIGLQAGLPEEPERPPLPGLRA
jgi:hypothetical protein